MEGVKCVKTNRKTAYGFSGVKSGVWYIGTHILSLIINEKKTTILDVKTAIDKKGHDTDEIKAADEDYNNLHNCCRYERI